MIFRRPNTAAIVRRMELTMIDESRIHARRRRGGALPRRDLRAVASFRVANSANAPDRRPTEFGLYLLRGMSTAGVTSQRDLARRAGVSNSTITRLIYGEGAPDRETLEKVAVALGLDYGDVLARADHGRPAVGQEQISLHPRAVEVDLLLSADSPLSEEDRRYLDDMIGRLVAPYRRYLRRRSSG